MPLWARVSHQGRECEGVRQRGGAGGGETAKEGAATITTRGGNAPRFPERRFFFKQTTGFLLRGEGWDTRA